MPPINSFDYKRVSVTTGESHFLITHHEEQLNENCQHLLTLISNMQEVFVVNKIVAILYV